MKKNIIVITLILLFVVSKLNAQTPEFQELNIPSSPAFVFLDQSPANIEKPSNPKALAITLLSVGKGGGAVEFSPYWLYNHATYTIEDEIKNHFPLAQTFALSLSSFEDNDVTNFSSGFRVQLLRMYTDEVKIISKKDAIVAELVKIPLDLTKINQLKKDFEKERAIIKWNIELAGAFSGVGSKTTDLQSNKLGGWLNIRHTPIKFPIDFVALARYNKTFGNTINNQIEASFFDFGGSISKQGDNFDLQLEYVYRRDLDLDLNYDRLAFVANIKISKDFVAVASLGKNFDEVDNVFTAIGIRFGLAKQKMSLN
jgi:hypothetical protein